MPFSFNLSSGNYLSTQDVEVLQRATRDHQMERLTIGERSFSVRYQSAMDAFIVRGTIFGFKPYRTSRYH